MIGTSASVRLEEGASIAAQKVRNRGHAMSPAFCFERQTRDVARFPAHAPMTHCNIVTRPAALNSDLSATLSAVTPPIQVGIKMIVVDYASAAAIAGQRASHLIWPMGRVAALVVCSLENGYRCVLMSNRFCLRPRQADLCFPQ